jgi:hypothetical protein
VEVCLLLKPPSMIWTIPDNQDGDPGVTLPEEGGAGATISPAPPVCY